MPEDSAASGRICGAGFATGKKSRRAVEAAALRRERRYAERRRRARTFLRSRRRSLVLGRGRGGARSRDAKSEIRRRIHAPFASNDGRRRLANAARRSLSSSLLRLLPRRLFRMRPSLSTSTFSSSTRIFLANLAADRGRQSRRVRASAPSLELRRTERHVRRRLSTTLDRRALFSLFL